MHIKDASEIIADEYYRLRSVWFPPNFHLPPAKLRFIYVPEDGNDTNKYASVDWAYDRDKHELQCLICEAHLDDSTGLAVGGMIDYDASSGETNEGMYDDDRLTTWADWRWNLVHEICHEYEHQVLCSESTSAGIKLYEQMCIVAQKKIKWTPPHKHPIAFYSAIAQFALHFAISPASLADAI